MLAVLFLIVGAAVSALLAWMNPSHDFSEGGFAASVIATGIQLVVAGALVARIPRAHVAAVAALSVQLGAVLLFALILMVLGALPMEGAGPFPGHPFNPTLFVLIVAGVVGALVLYLLGVRSALRAARSRTERGHLA